MAAQRAGLPWRNASWRAAGSGVVSGLQRPGAYPSAGPANRVDRSLVRSADRHRARHRPHAAPGLPVRGHGCPGEARNRAPSHRPDRFFPQSVRADTGVLLRPPGGRHLDPAHPAPGPACHPLAGRRHQHGRPVPGLFLYAAGRRHGDFHIGADLPDRALGAPIGRTSGLAALGGGHRGIHRYSHYYPPGQRRIRS